MGIKISGKRLRTVQGQLSVVEAAKLEKTLGNEVKIEGDPSLRVLLCDNINTYPYSDWLLAIQLLTEQHRYDDNNVRSTWIDKNIKRCRTPYVAALWANENRYDCRKIFNILPAEVTEKSIPMFDEATCDSILDAWCPDSWERGKARPVLNLRVLSTFLSKEDPANDAIAKHADTFLRDCYRRKDAQAVKAILFMANRHLRRRLATEDHSGVADVINEAKQLIQLERTATSVTAKLYDPYNFNLKAYCNDKSKEGSDD